jgi:tRNA pseudouridine55 synthase
VAEAPPPALDEKSVKKAVEAFSGKITQTVPPYSAVRLGGKHMYKLARHNVVMPVVKRDVDVKWLSWSVKAPSLEFEIECTGGTYIRSIACEIGRFMGSRAHLTALRRLSIGTWNVKDAITAEQLAAMTPEAALASLLPVPMEAGRA